MDGWRDMDDLKKYAFNFFKNAQMPMFIISDGKTEFINPSLERITGFTSDELTKSSFSEIIHPESRDKFEQMCNDCITINVSTRRSALSLLSKSSKKIHIFLYLKKIKIKDKSVLLGEIIDPSAYDLIEKNTSEDAVKLRKMLGDIIQTLIYVIETKDPYTAGHQRRVANLARAIATKMELSPEKTDAVRMAGTIHDIGKIGVPTEILSRPGELNPIEFELIKSHTLIGYNILKNINFSYPVADIIYTHHERLDGSGYPEGKTGNQIPIEAKIISVADTVEAISSRRPYRESRGIEAAMEEILNNRNTLFDSDVVDTCENVFCEGFRFDVN